jgi:hypothetical protein
MKVFDYDTLVMLFDEAGLDFEGWIADIGYTSDWTDVQIYSKLPTGVIDILDDVGMDVSWLQGGL